MNSHKKMATFVEIDDETYVHYPEKGMRAWQTFFEEYEPSQFADMSKTHRIMYEKDGKTLFTYIVAKPEMLEVAMAELQRLAAT
jgi:hypothetical protein